MAKNKIEMKYTVILTNYNTSFECFKKAVDSIFCQTYQNIELIITDDASEKFEIEKVKKYINNNKKKNIKSVDYVINKKNVGVTKTLNKAIIKSTGDYILFFASDDMLGEKNILEKYANAFAKRKENIITSQWVICDEELNKIENFISRKQIIEYNLFRKKLINDMMYSNRFGSGSTTYRRVIFEKYKIDEEFRNIEDWPFWLQLLKNGEKFYIMSADGLLHRKSGISDFNYNISNQKKIFYEEMLKTFEKLILNDIESYNLFHKFRVIRAYYSHIQNYENYIKVSNKYEIFKKMVNKDKKVKLIWIIDNLTPNMRDKIKILIKYNKAVVFSFIISFIVGIIIVNSIGLKNYNWLILIGIITYFICYCIGRYISNYMNIIRKKK